MAIEYIDFNDKQNAGRTKINSAFDQIIVSGTSISNGVLRFEKFGGEYLDITIPKTKNEKLAGFDITFDPSNYLTLTASTGSYNLNGNTYEVTSPTALSLNAGDATYPRIDLIVASGSTPTIKQGVATQNPSEPSLLSNEVKLGFIFVNSGASASGGTASQDTSGDINFLKFGAAANTGSTNNAGFGDVKITGTTNFAAAMQNNAAINGNYNTVFGLSYSNLRGNNNTILGFHQSVANNSTSNYNTYLGFGASNSLNSSSNNLTAGYINLNTLNTSSNNLLLNEVTSASLQNSYSNIISGTHGGLNLNALTVSAILNRSNNLSALTSSYLLAGIDNSNTLFKNSNNVASIGYSNYNTVNNTNYLTLLGYATSNNVHNSSNISIDGYNNGNSISGSTVVQLKGRSTNNILAYSTNLFFANTNNNNNVISSNQVNLIGYNGSNTISGSSTQINLLGYNNSNIISASNYITLLGQTSSISLSGASNITTLGFVHGLTVNGYENNTVVGYSVNNVITGNYNTMQGYNQNISITGSSNTVLGKNSTRNIIANDSVIFGGGLIYDSTDVATTPYNIIESDHIIFVYPSGGTKTMMLPNPTKGRELVFKDVQGIASTNNVIISGGTNTIDGAAFKTINTNYGTIRIICNGSGWSVL